MEAPRLGVKSELHLPAYAIATATRDPSRVCGLHHSSWKHQLLNPPSKARDRTCILTDTSRILNPLSHAGNSLGLTAALQGVLLPAPLVLQWRLSLVPRRWQPRPPWALGWFPRCGSAPHPLCSAHPPAPKPWQPPLFSSLCPQARLFGTSQTCNRVAPLQPGFFRSRLCLGFLLCGLVCLLVVADGSLLCRAGYCSIVWVDGSLSITHWRKLGCFQVPRV